MAQTPLIGVRRGHCVKWRRLRRRRAWRRFERTDREVFERWEGHQNVGKKGPAPGEFETPTPWLSIPKDVSVADRGNHRIKSSIRLGISRSMEAIRPGQRIFIDKNTPFTCPITNRIATRKKNQVS